MKALLKNVRISPKKANLVIGLIRKESVNSALARLKFMNKKAADIIYKVLFSAASNAKTNFGEDFGDLVVSSAFITEGPTYKRWQSRSKGRVFSLLKRTANINIELESVKKEDKKTEDK
ncbi:50S ribosomal protein L22 [Candidatus Gracilibacteria bacterium]|nr:50S ribosomal protein L22 [Candidatus Gracilibacteria bacterium]